ncbi:MAG: DUF177 domain-containing protein [Elusimicrobiota bacterium]
MKNLTFKTSEIIELGEINKSVDKYTCPEISDSVIEQELGVVFTLKPVEGNILLTGGIRGSLILECCRCLTTFAFPVDVQIQQVYSSNLEEINLEDEIRQIMILNTPLKPLCVEECKGLCPQCGKNLNNANSDACCCSTEQTDPRWDTLKKLIK